MSKQEVILCRNFGNDLINAIKKCPHDRLFVLTDENTHKHCLLNEKNIFDGKICYNRTCRMEKESVNYFKKKDKILY